MGRVGKRQEEKEKRLVARLPHYGHFPYARLGYFSLTTDDTKFISKPDALTINGVSETPGYFFGQFMKGLWCAKRSIANSEISYPYKAIPGKFPYAFYIDIRHAFKQIASAFGMEVFIQEGVLVAFGETLPNSECFNDKICRGLLVTGTDKTGSYQEWREHDLRTIRFSNPNYSPHIRYAIWCTLHAIQHILSPYTLYAHTDGFIVPRRHFDKCITILNQYGFAYTVKSEGISEIYGVGSYRIGRNETRAINRVYSNRSYIREDNAKWWLNYYQRGIELRNGFNLQSISERD